jgi:hypothetical protein
VKRTTIALAVLAAGVATLTACQPAGAGPLVSGTVTSSRTWNDHAKRRYELTVKTSKKPVRVTVDRTAFTACCPGRSFPACIPGDGLS